ESDDELLRVGSGREEASAVGVVEEPDELVGDGARLAQPGDIVDLGEGAQRLEERGVVLGVREIRRAPRAYESAVVAPQFREEEPRICASRRHPIVAVERGRRFGERAEHQRVPSEQNLVVEARSDTRATAGQQSRVRTFDLDRRFSVAY